MCFWGMLRRSLFFISFLSVQIARDPVEIAVDVRGDYLGIALRLRDVGVAKHL